VGIVIGVALAVATSAAGIPHRPAEQPTAASPPGTPPDYASEFLAAWARSRTISYVADTSFVRTVGGRIALKADGIEVRRPPEWLSRQGGSWRGVLGGRRVDCNNAVDGKTRCGTTDEVVDYGADVEAELQGFRSWLTGAASYAVERQGGCFDMRRIRPVQAPPLGDHARYCFDDAGLAVEIEITTATAVDHRTLGNVRLAVTDQDLQLPVASGDS
jgi:hypothetical protein